MAADLSDLSGYCRIRLKANQAGWVGARPTVMGYLPDSTSRRTRGQVGWGGCASDSYGLLAGFAT